MGKKRKPTTARPTPAPTPQAPPAVVVSLVEPRFWFGFEVTWAKLVIGRVLLFGLLAIDAVLAIRHAPRYGAGGFNVAQLPFLDGLGPTRPSYAICELVNAFLLVFAALGIGTRIVVPLAAAIYAWLYLGSQLDSYQHHYLVALVLAIASFVPWERPANAKPDTRVASWALRLILVQLAVLYLWAAISKMDPAWLDGRTLGGQIFATDAWFDVRHIIDKTIGMHALSYVIVAVELTLALTIWIKPAWIVAAPLGILFHLGIVFTKLEIGLFAWLMIGLYAFVVPDRVWVRLAESPLGRPLRAALAAIGRYADDRPLVAVAATLAGLALAFGTRLDYALAVALGIFVAPYIIAVALGRQALVGRIGIALLVAFGLWFSVDHATTVAADYYKFWGGSSRRLDDLQGAERAYRGLVSVAPEEPLGHFYLGKLLLLHDDELDGMAELHAAQALEPKRARAWIEEARFLQLHQRDAAALEKAKQALAIEPENGDVKMLISVLTNTPAPSIPTKKTPVPDEDREAP